MAKVQPREISSFGKQNPKVLAREIQRNGGTNSQGIGKRMAKVLKSNIPRYQKRKSQSMVNNNLKVWARQSKVWNCKILENVEAKPEVLTWECQRYGQRKAQGMSEASLKGEWKAQNGMEWGMGNPKYGKPKVWLRETLVYGQDSARGIRKVIPQVWPRETQTLWDCEVPENGEGKA